MKRSLFFIGMIIMMNSSSSSSSSGSNDSDSSIYSIAVNLRVNALLGVVCLSVALQ